MLPCPTCELNGIGVFAKFWSGAGSPCHCALCGQLSFVHSKHRYGLQSGWPGALKLLVALVLICAYFLRPEPAFIWALGICWIGCSLWELYIAPMQLISAEDSTKSNAYGYLFLLILAIAFVGLSYGVSR